jgi:nucleotide-binding universal stress UspA family protein
MTVTGKTDESHSAGNVAALLLTVQHHSCMQTILVTTDFSAPAANAVDYAACLAAITGAGLYLLHVRDNIPPPSEIPAAVPSWEPIENDIRRQLDAIGREIEEKYGAGIFKGADMRWENKAEKIVAYAREIQADLIVMGMQGAGYLAERFLGSTTTAVMRQAVRPVLAIHPGTKFKPVRKIVFATDGQRTSYTPAIGPVKEWAMLFGAHVFILHILPETAFTYGKKKLPEEGFHHVSCSFHYKVSDDVVEELNSFTEETGADLIIMVAHRHSVLQGILQESRTKRMMFHAKVPVLALHG